MRVVAAVIMLLAGGLARAPAVAQPRDTMPAATADARSTTPDDTYAFNIPSLPLSEALQRYGDLTGYSVIYETSVVAGKRSIPVHGSLSAEAALKRLLGDTSLSARFVNRRSIMLLARPAPDAGGAAPPSPMEARFDGQLQRHITRALCADPTLGAGRYRIALRFSIGSDQRLRDVRVRIAERPELEAAVRTVLTQLSVGAPPPGMAQPVVMIVSPEAARRYGGCPS